MAPPSRDQIEQMAFMAMMDGIMHTSVPCNCATCKSDGKGRNSARPPPSKRPDGNENTKPIADSANPGSCGHLHHHHHHHHSTMDSKSAQSTKKPVESTTQSRPTASTATTPARSDKINSLLKADSVQAVFDVFNLTSTSKDEKDLATKIQNATKDCKLYQETKDKILELCDDDDIDFDAVLGLLAKFRYERNMLTTAVIKGNSEREKALLCIQRVDHLMYMLQDVAKKKESKGNDVMHKLGDIIMEIHDLAKTPSTLYDEFLDIKEEHFDLLNDHEEMHQKFVDVNSCHEKLHSSHDKLQTEHTRLLKDFAEAKKKASTIGSLKNDVSRLEKAADRSNTENSELKKEVERLNAELAKVNALKHENAQLKKKVTTLSTQPTPAEEPVLTPQPSQPHTAKKKKGKKGAGDTVQPNPMTPEPTTEPAARIEELGKAHGEQVTKLKKAHDAIAHELETVRTNLKQLDAIVRKAENARDQATEKLEVQKATARNWKDIAKGHSNEKERLQAEVDRHITRATRLQSSVEELERSLSSTKLELAQQTEAHKLVKEELEHRSPTPAMSVTSHQTVSLGPDTIRLLRKIRSETNQMARDLEDPRSFGDDVLAVLEMIQLTVRRVVSDVERDIEEILSVKGNDPPISNHNHIPEAVLPFAYSALPQRQTPHFSPLPDNSPRSSPRISSSGSLPPYRPMMPPPGLNDSSSSPFNHSVNHPQHQIYNRNLDSPSIPHSRMAEPPGLSASLGFSSSAQTPRYVSMTAPSVPSLHSHSSLHTNNTISTPSVGVIGSRSTSTKLNKSPSPASTPTPTTSSGATTTTTPGAGASTSTTSASGLGNGAAGVDWNMWARSAR